MNNTVQSGINQRMEVKTAGNGNTWVTGTIRTRNKMPNKEGKYESSFLDYKVLGGRAATFAKYQQEGKPLAVSGWLVQENWERDGQKRSKHVLMVEDFDLPPFEDGQSQVPSKPKTAANHDAFSSGGAIDFTDELPF